ncbi:MAG: NAD-dependent epimerase/dehydratase family protein [Alphaproteobacteria bacterium]|nr:NAD-dependent epimerase/dehydratase family protein [Alphaproteobacteria bacterium]
MPTALIAGGLGVVGRALVEHLEDDPNWTVIGLSRRTPDFDTSAQFISVDLLNLADCKLKLGALTGVTHIFFTPYAARATFAEEVAPNLGMLSNLLDTIEPIAADLAHVQLMQGAKWYGVQFGAPYKTPAKEDDPRHMPPNFYYDQQDWLVERQKGKAWTWSGLRPHGVWGFSIGGRMNLMTGIVLYAAISKHLGLPLRWPGKAGFYDCLYNMIDVELLAEAMEWAATDPATANDAFNINNGDFFRWNQVWPRIAEFFDMEVGPVQTVPLQTVMADKEPVWAEIAASHGLQPFTLAELTNWDYLDMALGNAYDQMSSMTKARHAGWHKTLDTEATVARQMQRLRDDKIIP